MVFQLTTTLLLEIAELRNGFKRFLLGLELEERFRSNSRFYKQELPASALWHCDCSTRSGERSIHRL